MNKVILIGNLTKDAEVRSNENFTAISFSIAVKRDFKNKQGEYEVDFINCQYIRKEDKISKYLVKGTKVAIEGRIQTRTYEQDGVKKYVTEVNCNNLELLGSMPKVDNKSDNKVDNNENNNLQESDPFAEFGKEHEDDLSLDLPF